MGIEEDGLTISAVERELGIGKDTLRVWERRYGFPNPKRDANGERRYPPDQVARLRLVRRLLDQGMRPHQLLSLPADALEDGGQPGTA
jgi:DNA-binding transcriptional MerR regulator